MQADHTRTTNGRTTPTAEPIENMHDVFSSWWRRATLYYLLNHEDPASVQSLARQLVAWDRGDARLPEDPDAVDRMHRRLRRSHLGAMNTAGILGYDPEAKIVWLPDDVTFTVAPP